MTSINTFLKNSKKKSCNKLLKGHKYVLVSKLYRNFENIEMQGQFSDFGVPGE